MREGFMVVENEKALSRVVLKCVRRSCDTYRSLQRPNLTMYPAIRSNDAEINGSLLDGDDPRKAISHCP